MEVIDHLIAAIDQKSNPMIVGLDPIIRKIPDCVTGPALKKFGNTFEAATEAIYRFNTAILDSIHSLIPGVKIQMACYELYGAPGIEAFHKTVKLAKNYNLTVIDDSKRNDIGSTAHLYALGHLGKIPLIQGETVAPVASDFLTVNPWLGEDSILPFIEEGKKHQKGIFILVKTSNPSSGDYQDQLVNGEPLFLKVASDVNKFAQNSLGKRGYSSIGAVVGATWPEQLKKIRTALPHSYFLVPGFGAQGADSKKLHLAFQPDGYGAVINSSRGVIFARNKDPFLSRFPREDDFPKASHAAVLKARDEILLSLKMAGKTPSNW